MSWEALDPAILAPALVAGLLVLATHVPLGRQVLARGIVFLDLAVAQIAALGVIGAEFLGIEEPLWTQVVAMTAALLGALVLHWTDSRWGDVQEALIGVVFVLAATGGLLLLAHHPHGGEHLRDLLAGQILWVDWQRLGVAALATLLPLALWFSPRQPPGRLRFYLAFALAITLSVQLVGVYLVFASLILPALAVRNPPGRPALVVGYLLGIAGYASGLVASAMFDLPSGPAIVWTLAITALLVGAWRSRKGGEMIFPPR